MGGGSDKTKLVLISTLVEVVVEVEVELGKKNEIPPRRAREGLGLPSPRDFPRAEGAQRQARGKSRGEGKPRPSRARVGGISFFFIMSFSASTNAVAWCSPVIGRIFQTCPHRV